MVEVGLEATPEVVLIVVGVIQGVIPAVDLSVILVVDLRVIHEVDLQVDLNPEVLVQEDVKNFVVGKPMNQELLPVKT